MLVTGDAVIEVEPGGRAHRLAIGAIVIDQEVDAWVLDSTHTIDDRLAQYDLGQSLAISADVIGGIGGAQAIIVLLAVPFAERALIKKTYLAERFASEVEAESNTCRKLRVLRCGYTLNQGAELFEREEWREWIVFAKSRNRADGSVVRKGRYAPYSWPTVRSRSEALEPPFCYLGIAVE